MGDWVSVLAIVVAYRNRELTRRCVLALLAQSPGVRLFVWDNASGDGTAEMLYDMGIEHYASPENVYWTPAINAVVERYWNGEDCIAWLNNDTEPAPRCMERLEAELRDPIVGLVAPMTTMIGGPQDLSQNPAAQQALNRDRNNPDRALDGLPSRRCTFVLGACAMTKKSVWDEVGPLHPEMPLGADDHDWAKRVKDADYQIRVVQSAYCYHKGHASAGDGGKPHWDELGWRCWQKHDEVWEGYYFNESEAVRCHFDGRYFPGFDKGTGRLSDAERELVWKERRRLYDADPSLFHGEPF